jgi:chromosome segregation ATPase
LEEKINFLKFKIKNLQKEKNELHEIIDSNKDIRIETLETEINGYKNMTEGCIKSCAKLRQEIVQIKTDIEKCPRRRK